MTDVPEDPDPAALLRGRLFVSTADAATILGVDRRTLNRAISAGDIPAVRVGQQYRLSAAWLRAAAHLPGETEAA